MKRVKIGGFDAYLTKDGYIDYLYSDALNQSYHIFKRDKKYGGWTRTTIKLGTFRNAPEDRYKLAW